MIHLHMYIAEARDSSFFTVGPDPTWMDETPDFALLHLISYTNGSGKQKSYRFIQEIQNSCRQLGVYLGIDIATISGLERTSDSLVKFCENILEMWLQRGENVSWGGLLKALGNAQLMGAYNNLKRALSFHFK